MHTNQNLTSAQRQFRRWVKGQLADAGLTVTGLACSIGKHRNSVSRAINRGEFPEVQKQIRKELSA